MHFRRCAGRPTSPDTDSTSHHPSFRAAHEMPVNRFAVNRNEPAKPTPDAAARGTAARAAPTDPALSGPCRGPRIRPASTRSGCRARDCWGVPGRGRRKCRPDGYETDRRHVRDVVGSHGWLACGCHAMPVHSGGSTARPSIKRGSLPSAFITQSSRPEVRAAICVPSGDQAAAR